jgi:zinc protease
MRSTCFLACVCLLGCTSRQVAPLRYAPVAGAQDELFRATPPPRPHVAEILDAPSQTWTLPNGFRAMLVERHDYPMVAVRLLVDRGAIDLDDPGALQVTETMHLYQRGGTDAAFEALRAEAARTGARFVNGTRYDAVWAGFVAPQEALESSLDALKRQTFDADLGVVEYDRRSAAWEQVARAGSVSLAAAERWVLFGDQNPYGFVGPGRDMIPMKVAQSIHARLFRPAHATLVVVGDVALDRLTASVDRVFGPLARSAGLPRRAESPPAHIGPRVSVLSARGLTQMHGMVFARGPVPSSDDMLALSLAARLLGTGFSSVLFEQIREESGAAYLVGEWTSADRTASWVSFGASYDADKAVDGIGIILAAVRELRAGHVTEEQIAVAREASVAEWRAEMATLNGAAELYASSVALGLDPNWPRSFPERVASLGRDDLVRVANRYLTDRALHVVFQGDDRWLDTDRLGMGGAARLELESK